MQTAGRSAFTRSFTEFIEFIEFIEDLLVFVSL